MKIFFIYKRRKRVDLFYPHSRIKFNIAQYRFLPVL